MARTRTREELRSVAVKKPCDKIGLKSDVLRLTSVNGGIGSRLRWSLGPERSRLPGQRVLAWIDLCRDWLAAGAGKEEIDAVSGPDGQTGGIGTVRSVARSDRRHRRGQTGLEPVVRPDFNRGKVT
uniref:Uncharacterized protein n=1 Tax=Leersia perrieri TaxID=77586 RepID=A0A0D9WX81_9ORYZ